MIPRYLPASKGFSLLECMVALQLLGIFLLALSPLIYTGILLQWSGRVRTEAIRLLQNRQAISRSLITAEGGCTLSSHSGQEDILVARRKCRLEWSLIPADSVPQNGEIKILQLRSTIRCPARSGESTFQLNEIHSCR